MGGGDIEMGSALGLVWGGRGAAMGPTASTTGLALRAGGGDGVAMGLAPLLWGSSGAPQHRYLCPNTGCIYGAGPGCGAEPHSTLIPAP